MLTRYHSASRKRGRLAEDQHLREPGNGGRIRLAYYPAAGPQRGTSPDFSSRLRDDFRPIWRSGSHHSRTRCAPCGPTRSHQSRCVRDYPTVRLRRQFRTCLNLEAQPAHAPHDPHRPWKVNAARFDSVEQRGTGQIAGCSLVPGWLRRIRVSGTVNRVSAVIATLCRACVLPSRTSWLSDISMRKRLPARQPSWDTRK